MKRILKICVNFVFVHINLLHMLRIFFLYLITLANILSLHAQSNLGICGTHGGEWEDMLTDRLLRNKMLLDQQPLDMRNTIYVPVTIHMVANGSGFGRVTHAQVLDMMCRLNQDFDSLNMRFYIKTLNENINNTGIYATQYSAGFVMGQLRDPAAMNIWVVDQAAGAAPGPNDPPGTTLGYYSPSRDWIVIRKDQANANSVTLAHEVGHFFSIRHTHNGWDSQPWTTAIGNPAPVNAPGGVPTERHDGSNCQTAGDFICDTPADYNGLGFNGCNYNIAQDPTGAFINPDEQLFMSYFLSCNRNQYYFSNTQKSLMMTDYNHSSRNYLRPGVTPALPAVEALPTLTFPINNEFAPGFNSVNLQWTAVPGAQFYLLEIDVNQTFSSTSLIRRVVTGGANNFTENTLQASRTYFWRVRPYNFYSTCMGFTPAATFRTNTMVVSTSEIQELDEWTISPNPIVAQQSIQLSLQASKSFNGLFSLYSTAGQQVRTFGRQIIQQGNNNLRFDLNDMLPGVYLLVLDHDKGREIKRVVIAQ
jgi:hypothetical protein